MGRSYVFVPVSALLLAKSVLAAPPRAADPARPVTPSVIPPFEVAADACDQTDYESVLIKQLTMVHDAGAENDKQNQALADWKLARLEAAGAWSKADRQAFHLKMLGDPVIKARLVRKQAVMTSMMEALAGQEAAKKANPETACRLLVAGLRPVFAEFIQNATDWAHTQGLYAAEAKRLGVSLAE